MYIELMTMETNRNGVLPNDMGSLAVTVDSGAGVSLCGPWDAPNSPRQFSNEQQRGAYYMVAGVAGLPTMGEKHVQIRTAGGKRCRVILVRDQYCSGIGQH